LEVQVAQPDAPAVSADSAAAAAASAGAQAALARSVSDGPTPGKLVAKGIDGPEQRAPLQYSAPSVDGDGGVITRGDGGKKAGARPAAAAGGDGTANREARRKAAKQQRKR